MASHFKNYGTGADYLAARIKRDRPDIAEAVIRGEYRSMRKAAIDAGILPKPPAEEDAAIDRLLLAWDRADNETRYLFLNLVSDDPEWRPKPRRKGPPAFGAPDSKYGL